MTTDIRIAGQAVLDAADAYRDALNGCGHPGEKHDDWLGHSSVNGISVRDTVADCSACGGAQYGADDALTAAYGNLRAALGHERLPWEYER